MLLAPVLRSMTRRWWRSSDGACRSKNLRIYLFIYFSFFFEQVVEELDGACDFENLRVYEFPPPTMQKVIQLD